MIWANEETRLKALKNISKAEKYKKVIDAVYEVNKEFESTILMDFYQKVRDEVRKVNKNHILFLEHSYFSNTGVYSAIYPLVDESGKPDPLQAYAAHGYDLLTDTKEVDNPSYERVELIYSRIAETSQRLNMPVLLGEWGAYHSGNSQMVRTADQAVRLIEKFKFSNTYWAYYNNIDKHAYFNHVIIRPFPDHISGKLISYDYEINSGIFNCQWSEDKDIDEPTRLYIPDLDRLSEEELWIEPESDKIILESIPNAEAGYLIISPTGEAVTRSLKLKFSDVEVTNISLK
jgi:endoglycosylceramidase